MQFLKILLFVKSSISTWAILHNYRYYRYYDNDTCESSQTGVSRCTNKAYAFRRRTALKIWEKSHYSVNMRLADSCVILSKYFDSSSSSVTTSLKRCLPDFPSASMHLQAHNLNARTTHTLSLHGVMYTLARDKISRHLNFTKI